MPKRTFQITGQSPNVNWRRNKGRKRRSIEEARVIAEENGVIVPPDVEFVLADKGELNGSLAGLLAGKDMTTARIRAVAERDGYVYWRDHIDSESGKIRIRVHPDILTSDEAIVGVFQHEMFELAELRDAFVESRKGLRMNATDYGHQTAKNRRGNFHDQAWDSADELVRKMRGEDS